MRIIKPGAPRPSSAQAEDGRGTSLDAAAKRVELVKAGKLAPVNERWPVQCEIKDCTNKWYTLIIARWLPVEIAPKDGIYVCDKHYKWLQFRHGRVMGYTQEKGRAVSYVAEELF